MSKNCFVKINLQEKNIQFVTISKMFTLKWCLQKSRFNIGQTGRVIKWSKIPTVGVLAAGNGIRQSYFCSSTQITDTNKPWGTPTRRMSDRTEEEEDSGTGGTVIGITGSVTVPGSVTLTPQHTHTSSIPCIKPKPSVNYLHLQWRVPKLYWLHKEGQKSIKLCAGIYGCNQHRPR